MTFSNDALRLACLCTLLAGLLPAQTAPPHYSPSAAVKAEWERRLPPLSEAEVARLAKPDRARWERSRLRIGQPGAPELLPPELAAPTLEIWERKAQAAHSPEARFTALFFLNRLKSPKALEALAGLKREDAPSWPGRLHLENSIATARLNGSSVSSDLQGFLEGLKTAGKLDPVRAQAGQLRLLLAGKEQALLPLVPATPHSVLALVDALKPPKPPGNEARIMEFLEGRWESLGLLAPAPGDAGPSYFAAWRLLDLPLPEGAVDRLVETLLALHAQHPTFFFKGFQAVLPRLSKDKWKQHFKEFTATASTPLEQAAMLPELRKSHANKADALRKEALASTSAVARAAGIEDLPKAPDELEALVERCFKDTDLESTQTLLQAFERWQLPVERQRNLLSVFLQHPDWGWRYQAYRQARKLDPELAWPAAPELRPNDSALLKEAQRLATKGQPVRLRITFSAGRTVTLRLDPTVAPINVANLKRLTEAKFFDGRLVPRIVPDFVVQMGSPYDTMDGGPGYTVRCENSLNWYGPGSVGMALSGKDTGGSQFFITTNATPHLTGKYTRVGAVEQLDRSLRILDNLELGAKIVSIRVLP